MAFRQFYPYIEQSIQHHMAEIEIKNMFETMFKEKPDFVKADKAMQLRINSMLKAITVNTDEDDFSRNENEVEQLVLSRLRQGDKSILEDVYCRVKFISYIWEQFFRTKRSRQAYIKAKENITANESTKNLFILTWISPEFIILR